MQYTPNFNDPRVRARCKKALGFAYAMLSPTTPKQCHSRTLDRFFGQGQTQLSQYLKSQLITLEDPVYMFGEVSQCKTYWLNRAGAHRLYHDIYGEKLSTSSNAMIKPEMDLVADVFSTEHKQELESGEFAYKSKSNRLWHPLQNVRSEPRKYLFNQHGYNNIYDIKACAPTLIAHLASGHAQKQTITVKRMNNTFEQFLSNTPQFRKHIAGLINSDITTAKKLINSLFAGARLGCNRDFDTFKMLNYDVNSMKALQTDPQLTGLRTAIAKAWKIIETGEGVSIAPGKRLSSKHKWAIYFKYERAIMSVVTDYMDKQYIQYFLEHDGWSCNTELDLVELTQLVRRRTGISRLDIVHETYEQNCEW